MTKKIKNISWWLLFTCSILALLINRHAEAAVSLKQSKISFVCLGDLVVSFKDQDKTVKKLNCPDCWNSKPEKFCNISNMPFKMHGKPIFMSKTVDQKGIIFITQTNDDLPTAMLAAEKSLEKQNWKKEETSKMIFERNSNFGLAVFKKNKRRFYLTAVNSISKETLIIAISTGE